MEVASLRRLYKRVEKKVVKNNRGIAFVSYAVVIGKRPDYIYGDTDGH